MVMTEKQKLDKSSSNIFEFSLAVVHVMLMKCDRLFPQACRAVSLTFVDDSKDDLSAAAVHIWAVAHLAAVGAIKGRRHLMQGDGNVPSHNIS